MQRGHLTDNNHDVIAGKRDQLSDKIQEAYGVSKADAEKLFAEWQVKQDKAKQAQVKQRHSHTLYLISLRL